MEIARLAFSPDKRDHLAFVNRIDELTAAYGYSFVNTQMLPFLINWYNPTLIEIGRILSQKCQSIISDTSPLGLVSAFISVLALSNDVAINKNLTCFFSNFNNKHCIETICTKLASSDYDNVRAIVAYLLKSVKNENIQKLLIQKLASDRSFSVKMSLLRLINETPEDLSLFVAEQLMQVPDAKLRHLVATLTKNHSYFSRSIFPVLIKDPDWFVRASAIKAASESNNPGAMLNDLVQAYNDVWEIKVMIMKIISTLLLKSPERFENEDHVFALFQRAFPELLESSLGIQVIHLFLGLIKHGYFKPDADDFRGYVYAIYNSQIQSNWCYFLKSAIKNNDFDYTPYLMETHLQFAVKCLQSFDYTIREQMMKIFTDLYAKINDENTHKYLISLSLSACQDQANPVRVASAEFLIKIATLQFDNLSQMIQLLAESSDFRNRQVGYMIILGLLNTSNDEKILEFARKAKEKLSNDPQVVVRNIEAIYPAIGIS